MGRTFVNVKDPAYGAIGDGVANDSGAIQAAITAVKAAGGGTLYFPAGTYLCSSQLVADGAHSIVFQGTGMGNGQGHQPPSRIKFTLSGAGSAFSLRSIESFRFQSIGIVYGNSGFTGTLLDFSHDGVTNTDSTNVLFDHCLLYSVSSTSTSDTGAPIETALCIVSLLDAINFTFRTTKIGGAQWGVRGRDKAASGYSNTVTFEGRCQFDSCTSAFIANAGQSWVLRDPVFEMLRFGGVGSGSNHVYASDYNIGATGGGDLAIYNAWYGDLSPETTSAIRLDATDSFTPLTIDGGIWAGGTATMFDLFGAITGGGIKSAHLSGTGTAIDLGSVGGGAGLKRDFEIDCPFDSFATEVANRGGHWKIKARGQSTNSTFDDIFELTNPRLFLTRRGPTNALPTATPVTPGAGTGASVTVRRGADLVNAIQFTVGTTPVAGDFLSITLVRSLVNELMGGVDDPYLAAMVFPMSAAAAAAGLYHDWPYGAFTDTAYRLDKLMFGWSTPPVAGTTIYFGYLAFV